MVLLKLILLYTLLNTIGCSTFIGKGYNLLHGNPDGVNPISGGLDPGIKDRQIIENNLPNKKYVNFSQNCDYQSGVKWYYGEKAYQQKLLKSFRASGDGNYNVHKKAFLKSSQLTYLEEQVFSNYLVVQEFHKTCILDSVRQPLYNPYSGQYNSVTDEFAAAVCSLSPTYVEEEYKEFIDTWGTHVILSAEVGTKEIKRYQISDMSLFSHIQDQVPEAIFPDLKSGKKNQVIDFTVFNAHPVHSNRVGAYLSHFFVGTKDEPRPVFLDLVSIDMMLQKKFWERLNKYIMESLCSESTTVDDIIKKKELIVQALRDYITYINDPTVSEIAVKTVWPEGSYLLLQTARQQYSGGACPTGVSWDKATITWCTGGRNEWSQTFHFVGGYQSSNMQLSFCTKRDNSAYRQALPWPKGNYCLTSYNYCPNGFTKGYVYWKYPTTSSSSSSFGYNYNTQCTQQGSYGPGGSVNRDGRKIEFCCRNDSDTSIPIALPRDTPFYLIRNNNTSECQDVKGMIPHKEYITWNNGNLTSSDVDIVGGAHPMVDITDDSDITMHFCYYENKV